MKVKTKTGGFFYDGNARGAGEEIDVPEKVGKSWVETGIADEVKPARQSAADKKKAQQKAEQEKADEERALEASENTQASGPQETRG